MTTQGFPRQLTRFYRSNPAPCPYLPDRMEQQLFAELNGPLAHELLDTLSLAGFRRSHHIVYRPACSGCTACIPVRVSATGFHPTPSLRRIKNRNADLAAKDVGLTVTEEQYALFHRYVSSRHGDGEMAGMGMKDYAAMVMSSRAATSIVEFRDAEDTLAAACLVDILNDGLSAVYSFFDPKMPRRSLGTHMIIWLVERSLACGLDYAYLGYWVPGSPKMEYKARFHPLEALGPTGWQLVGNPEPA